MVRLVDDWVAEYMGDRWGVGGRYNVWRIKDVICGLVFAEKHI